MIDEEQIWKPVNVGRRWALLLGSVALAYCAIDVVSPTIWQLLTTGKVPDSWEEALRLAPFFQAYLTAFCFWTNLAVGCLAIALLHQLVGGKWGVCIERICEAAAATLPLLAALFIPIFLGMRFLYPWTASAEGESHAAGLQDYYLNETGFVLRAVLYFAIWIILSATLRRWTHRRDIARDDAAHIQANIGRLSAGGLVLLGLTYSFAAIDWFMSLEPEWYSSIYAMILAAGGMLCGFALSVACLYVVRENAEISQTAEPSVLNDLGNLILAFIVIWAYVSFSQFLITWSGNTQVEIAWYLKRLENGWQWIALSIVLLHFAVPFLWLLSRSRKRNLASLAIIGVGILAIEYLNVYWIIVPGFQRAPYQVFATGWTFPPLEAIDLAAAIVIGGVWIWFLGWRLQLAPLVGVGDPARGDGASRAVGESHG